MGEGRPTLGTGFWFALGHSSVVFALSLLLALGVRALAALIQDQDSALQHSFGVVGSLAAGMFLIVVGLMNLSALLGLVHAARHLRAGTFDEDVLEHHLHNRGFLARIFKRTTQKVSKPWHLYPIDPVGGRRPAGRCTATAIGVDTVGRSVPLSASTTCGTPPGTGPAPRRTPAPCADQTGLPGVLAPVEDQHLAGRPDRRRTAPGADPPPGLLHLGRDQVRNRVEVPSPRLPAGAHAPALSSSYARMIRLTVLWVVPQIAAAPR